MSGWDWSRGGAYIASGLLAVVMVAFGFSLLSVALGIVLGGVTLAFVGRA